MAAGHTSFNDDECELFEAVKKVTDAWVGASSLGQKEGVKA